MKENLEADAKSRAMGVLLSPEPKLEDITPEVLKYGLEIHGQINQERMQSAKYTGSELSRAEFLRAGKSLLLGNESGQKGLITRIFEAQSEKTEDEIYSALNRMANDIIKESQITEK